MANNVIALDTGISTGYAVLDDTGEVLESGTWVFNDAVDANQYDYDGVGLFSGEVDDLLLIEQLTLLQEYYGDNCIIEYALTPSHSALDNRLREINEYIRTVFPKADVILPPTWKNHRVALHPVYPTKFGKLTQHQKDAICIARYKLQQK